MSDWNRTKQRDSGDVRESEIPQLDSCFYGLVHFSGRKSHSFWQILSGFMSPKFKATGTVGIERASLLIALAGPPPKNIYIFSPKDCILLLKTWSFLSWHFEPPRFVYGMVLTEKATQYHRVYTVSLSDWSDLYAFSNLLKKIMCSGLRNWVNWEVIFSPTFFPPLSSHTWYSVLFRPSTPTHTLTPLLPHSDTHVPTHFLLPMFWA